MLLPPSNSLPRVLQWLPGTFSPQPALFYHHLSFLSLQSFPFPSSLPLSSCSFSQQRPMQPTSQGWRLSLPSGPGRWHGPAGKTTGDPRAVEWGSTGRLGSLPPVQRTVWMNWLHESSQGPDDRRLCCSFWQHPPTWWVFPRPSK